VTIIGQKGGFHCCRLHFEAAERAAIDRLFGVLAAYCASLFDAAPKTGIKSVVSANGHPHDLPAEAIISDCVVQIAGDASMEHPLRVEEFSPSELPLSAAIEPAVAEASLAAAASAPLPALPNLPSSDVLFLRPSDPHYADYLPAANKRKQLSPALRAVCKTEHAVAIMVDWARTNQLRRLEKCIRD